MGRTRRLWRLQPVDLAAAARVAQQARISEVVAQLLWQRGIRDAEAARRFLEARLTDLLPPHRLPGITAAAERILHAVRQRQRICIYGDYDVDGITATAILLRILRFIGADVIYHTPLRLSEGYGLNAERIRELKRDNVAVIVTVDCGIASISEALVAKEVGIELIVTDHHEMKASTAGPLLPDAAVVVHPRLPGGDYPYPDLCGAGIAWKLAWELARRVCGTERVTPEWRELLLDALSLAALGSISDVVRLRDENRIFVRHGLERLRQRPGIGLQALMQVAGLQDIQRLDAEDVGFRLAPRLNAAGRLGCARMAVDLLTTQSATVAATAARFLEEQNAQRQSLERKIAQEAREIVERDFAADPAIVLASPQWHPGVVGIVAARLVEHFGKPAVVIAIRAEEDLATGSGRSVPGFALHEALRACESLLEGHGGHAAAAGLRIRPSNIAAFRRAFNAYAATHLPATASLPHLLLDTELPLSSLTPGLLNELHKLEPHGPDNPKPRFLAANLQVERPRRIGQGEEKRHLDFLVCQGSSRFRAVAWNMADRYEELAAAERVCVAFTPRVNTWNGHRRIELQVIDFQVGSVPQLD